MRFLVDECAGPTVAAWLVSRGRTVFSVFDEARGINDGAILSRADAENWIIVTNDKDFGDMVYRDLRPHRGVVLLRLDDGTPEATTQALDRLLAAGVALEGRFVVVTSRGIRVGGEPWVP